MTYRFSRFASLTLAFALIAACGGGKSDSPASPPVAPTLTLSANPASIPGGESSLLSWNATNATSCTASGGWSGAKATSGSESTGTLTTSTTYTLTCMGPGGSVSDSASVSILGAPEITLTATPSIVMSGGSSTLSWSATNVTACTASAVPATTTWSGSQSLAGSKSTGALTTTTDFSLSCTSANGTTARTVRVAVGPTSSIFPLHTESGKRFLIDAQGHPFLIQADAAWSLIVQLTAAQAETYLEDRRAKGFNAVLVNLIEHEFADSPPKNKAGDAPFLSAGDYATPNPAYFAHAEDVLDIAESKGILVMLTPSYMGYGGGSQGWYQEMSANGATKLRAYGQYLASRFASHDNILWVHGGDYNPPEKNLLRAIVEGIRDVDTTGRWQHTFHGARNTSALGFLDASDTWLTVNNIYTDDSNIVSKAFTEYARSTMPFFLIEANYEGEGQDGLGVRRQAYQAVLSGAGGQTMGNNPIWLFGPGWPTALNSDGSRTVVKLNALLESFGDNWTLLAPDQGNTFLTSGQGSGGTRAPASLAVNGSFGVIYSSSGSPLNVNLARLNGPNARASWYDPGNGTFSTISGSPFPAIGSRSFSPPASNSEGDSDWVLVLESVP